MRGWLWVAASLLFGTAVAQNAPAGQPDSQQVTFKFDRPVPGVRVPRYTIELKADGTGSYRAEVRSPQSPDVQVVERPLVFSPATVGTVFEAVHQLRSSDTPCASKAKNIADTGTKTIDYRDQDGPGGCTFNFSENKAAVQLTDLFLGVENTLEEGRSLDFKHRFDRLGLDAEMASLAAAVDKGTALELANISGTLRSIAGDTELIQRVRLRASKLLDGIHAGS